MKNTKFGQVLSNRKRKARLLILLLCLILVLLSVFCSSFRSKMVLADTENSTITDLEDNVNDQLKNLDFSGFDEILKQFSSGEKDIFSSDSFLDKVKAILSGQTSIDFRSISSAIFSLFSNDILQILPVMCLIIGIGILSSIISNTGYSKDKSVADIVHFVCYGTIVMIVFASVKNVITLSSNSLLSLKSQMEISFPILLTLMTSVGSVVSVGVYQPTVAILSGSMMTIFSNFVMPLFIFCLVFNVAGNLSDNVKLGKFSNLFLSIYKWTIGLIFTLFSAFLTIQGITAGSYDGLSIRTTKYAMKSYIPFVGSYLSDGLNLILTSSILIKNSVGLAGLLLLVATVITPISKILILKLALSLSASILEPICDKKIPNFLTNISKCLSMLIATICVAGFAYLITIGLVMCTGNII